MPQTYRIDQAATFAGVVLLTVEPKLAFGSTEQDRTGEGVPKWEAQLVAGFHQFGKVHNEVLRVGVAAHGNPGDGVTAYTPVELVGLEIGVMEKKNRSGEIVGAHVWYRAEQLRATSSTASRKPPHHVEGA